MSVSEVLPNVSRNLVVVPVYLVAHQNPQNFGRGVLLNLPQPVWTAVEGWLVGHIVDQDEGVGRPVVRLGDAPEPGGEGDSESQPRDLDVLTSPGPPCPRSAV